MPERTQPRHWNSQGFFPFRLEVLTPVFIGSGETLSPLNYVIRQEGKSYRLYGIDLQAWLMAHASDQSVQNIIASGDIARIHRMLDEKVNATEFSLFSCRIDDALLITKLTNAYCGTQNRDAGQRDKTGDVSAALRNPADGCLYIPGSSLKGAISTPLINWLDKSSSTSLLAAMKSDPRRGMAKQLEALFGSIREHAMQALKVSDVSLPSPFAGAIVHAQERSLKPEKQGTPKPPCEVILPDEKALWGRLLMDCPDTKPTITLPSGKMIPFNKLVQICNEFYKKRFQDEMSKFYICPHLQGVRKALQSVDAKINALDGNTLLLRVGHYSHVESVTVDKNQPYTRNGKDGKPMPYGTTRTLADGKLPFGWVLLHFCTPDDYEKGLRENEKERSDALATQRKALAAHREEAQAREAEAARILREKEERVREVAQKAAMKQAEQEELEQQMAKLPPEDAKLLKLKTQLDEALSMEIFRDMEGWTPELQKKAAEALRECWKKLGKWEGKQSKKQESKIKRVKQLLS